jgi:hypothetical protein
MIDYLLFFFLRPKTVRLLNAYCHSPDSGWHLRGNLLDIWLRPHGLVWRGGADEITKETLDKIAQMNREGTLRPFYEKGGLNEEIEKKIDETTFRFGPPKSTPSKPPLQGGRILSIGP